MRHRRLGKTLDVSAIGLGCMGMSGAYGGQDEKDAIATLRRAVDVGVTFFDTAEVYGPFENEKLVGKALGPVRDKVVIATKFGFKLTGAGVDWQRMALDSRPENVKAVADASLQRLGIDVIDLFYQHRVDPNVPIEETVGAMADLVKAGEVRALGLSEASAASIQRAHAIHPIAAVQSEYSLWTRGVEAEVLPTCKELGIGLVPYSPLGRGFLTGAIRDRKSLGDNDFRLSQPRFSEAAFDANLAIVGALERLAEAKGVTAAQLALAWLLAQGDAIVPIPGARKIRNLEDNAAAAGIDLSRADLAAIEAAVPHQAITGARYAAAQQALVDG